MLNSAPLRGGDNTMQATTAQGRAAVLEAESERLQSALEQMKSKANDLSETKEREGAEAAAQHERKLRFYQ